MIEQPLIARRNAARLLMGPLAAFYVPIKASGMIDKDEQEKVAAERVAKKVEKAKHSSREEKNASEAVRHFKKELAEYAALHTKESGKLGKIEDAAVQKALAAAIVARRRDARQGDLFLVEVQPLFKRLLAVELKGPDSLPAKKAVAEGNPGHDEDAIPVAVKVNGPYPRGAARSTVPPSILLTLPELPECLNYLFVGRDLILVDVVAQLIVDFIPAAAPELIK